MKNWKLKKEPEFRISQHQNVLAKDSSFFKYVGNLVLSVFWFFIKLPYNFGNLVIALVGLVFSLPYSILRGFYLVLQSDLRKTKQGLLIRKFRFFSEGHFFSLLVMVLVALFVFVSIGANRFIAQGLAVKGRVLGQATFALADLRAGKSEMLGESDKATAVSHFTKSWQRFEQAKTELLHTSFGLRLMAEVLPAGKDAVALLKAGGHISKAGESVANIYASLTSIEFTDSGITGLGGFSLEGLENDFSLIKSELLQSASALEEVDVQSLPTEYRDKLALAQALSAELHTLLPAVESLVVVATELFRDDRHMLVFLQNSNELRPTGGFMGTFGALDVQKGFIIQKNISSIYDLDGQLKQEFLPPMPVLAVNSRWYLRDTNWFFNFPESARLASEFYTDITGRTPDVVLAITPQVVTRLLQLTGEVQMPQYGLGLSAENFIERTQVETSVLYDREENKPKQMIADFFPIFLSRLSTLDATGKKLAWKALLESMSGKDVQIYSRHDKLEQALSRLGWSGELKQTERDYLAVVSSNLGGTKTDLSLQQTVELESRVGKNGKVVNTLKLTRTNPLPDADGLVNKSFVRFYVPKGSKLLGSSGFDFLNLEVKYNLETNPHPVVSVWESSAIKTISSGVQVGLESDKTYFGSWLVLRGGETKTVVLEYELPFELLELDRMSLVVDNQAGAVPYELDYRLHFPGRELDFGTEGLEMLSEKVVQKMQVDKAKLLGVVLRKK